MKDRPNVQNGGHGAALFSAMITYEMFIQVLVPSCVNGIYYRQPRKSLLDLKSTP